MDVIKRNVGPFEGDLDSERRSCLKADAASTWRMWVGDGKCRVPPASPGEEHVATMRRSGRATCGSSWKKLKLKLSLTLLESQSEVFCSENEAAGELFVY